LKLVINILLSIKLILLNFKIFKKEYGNIDCDTVGFEFIGNQTKISWKKPDFFVDYYEIDILVGGTSENNSFTFNSTNNSVTLFSIKYFEELLELNNLYSINY